MGRLSFYEDLDGKHVFITGGATGIGSGLVKGFIENNCRVSFVDIDRESGEKLVAAATSLGTKSQNANFFLTDVSDVSSLKSAIVKAREAYGAIDILINNAANDKRHELANTEETEWNELLAINLSPHFFTAQAVVEDMKAKNSGAIINLSSNSCLLGLQGYPAYVTSKAGILGLTKALARDLGKWNIRVNSLLPGWVMTEKQKRLWVTETALAECMEEQCLKSTLEEEDITNAALFLASNAAKMITGQAIVVDGGRA